MLIYKATNTISGKVYIGKTIQSLDARWRSHLRDVKCNSSAYFHHAIRKYGPDVFKVEVIHTAKTLVELSKMETFFIVLYQSFKTENGYNRTMGGDGGGVPTEATRKLMSSAKKGKPSLRRGLKMSQESKDRISAAKLGRPQSVKRKFINLSEERKQKIGLATAARMSADGGSLARTMANQRWGTA